MQHQLKMAAPVVGLGMPRQNAVPKIFSRHNQRPLLHGQTSFHHCVFFSENNRPSQSRSLWQKEEYEEQGRIETEKQLKLLQEQIKGSPEPLTLMSKLSKDTVHKVINFSLNGSHLNDSDSEEELTASDDDNSEQTFAYPRANGYAPSPVRENRASNLRRQVLQKNSRIPRPQSSSHY